MTRSKIRTTKWSIKHTIQRKRQKIVDYRGKSFYDFRLMIVDSTQKLDNEESSILSSSFGISRGNQSNSVISKLVLTHPLKALGRE